MSRPAGTSAFISLYRLSNAKTGCFLVGKEARCRLECPQSVCASTSGLNLPPECNGGTALLEMNRTCGHPCVGGEATEGEVAELASRNV